MWLKSIALAKLRFQPAETLRASLSTADHRHGKAAFRTTDVMDKKTKKRLELMRRRLQQMQQQLAGARQQTDEPDEIASIEQQIEKIKNEIAELKKDA